MEGMIWINLGQSKTRQAMVVEYVLSIDGDVKDVLHVRVLRKI